MMTEEQQDGDPFAEIDELLLQSHLSEVPKYDDIDTYEFQKEDIESSISDIKSQIDLDSYLTRWERYFLRLDGSSDTYVLDTETIIEDWVATLVDHSQFDNPSNSDIQNGGESKVTVDILNRGTITFILFFDSEELLRTTPHDKDADFLVAFRKPKSGVERKFVFRWQDVANDDFPNKVYQHLIENQVPPTIELFNSGSFVAKKAPNGPIRALKSIAKHKGYDIKNQPQLNENIQLAAAALDVSSVSTAIELNSDTHLTVCDCDESATENTHVHVVEDGQLISPLDNSECEEILEILSNKIEDYNDLTDDYENVSRMDRILQVIIVAMILPSLAYIFNLFLGQSVNDGLFILNFIAFIVLVLILLYVWSPLLQLRLFSWENPRSPNGLIAKLLNQI